MSTTETHTMVSIHDAQRGDFIRQAGELVEIEQISFLRGSACITFVGGGYMSTPAHHIAHALRPVPQATTSAPLIKTRRSCIGCGMRPGHLHSNGLCATCQSPTADTYAPVGNEA